MKFFEMRDHLQELEEVMLDKNMATMMLSALPKEWGKFTSSIYDEKESMPLNEIYTLCKIDDTILKAKDDVGSEEKVFVAMSKRKGKFGKFGP